MRALCPIGAVAACATPFAVVAGPCQIKQLAEFQVETTNNRPIGEGTINGQPVRILIDTGSSMTLLTGALAKQLGLDANNPVPLHIYGVGGEKHVGATRLKKLQFGNFTLTDLTVAVVSPQSSRATGAREGLFIVGADLLSQYTVEFDFARHVMRFMRPENCKPEQLVYWSKTFSMGDMDTGRADNPHIETHVVLNGKSIDALLDTGAQVSWSTPYAARMAGVTNQAADHPVDDRMRGSNGAAMPSFLGDFQTISIGDDETVRDVKLWVADLFAADTAVGTGSHIAKPVDDLPNLLIGCDFFLAHRVIASFQQRKILFTYNGGPIFQAREKPPAQGERSETISDAAAQPQ